ncbi:MAG TPA: MFS transporter [Stellaceae bacterium]|nr:MFS transporter [Stellaceae bacterium]
MTDRASAAPAARAASGVYFGWWVLLAATVGQVFGASNMLLFSLGVFSRPLAAEFGWTRPQLAVAGTIILWSMVVVSPIQGWLVDRFGTRRVNLTTMPLFAVALASLYFLPPNIMVFYVAWFGITLCGIVLWSGPYNKIVAAWFDRRLGLTLGLANAGQGLGTAIIPPYTQLLVGHFGWRAAYVGLGAAMLIPFLFNLALLRDRPQDRGLLPDGDRGDPATVQARAALLSGLTVRECLHRPAFWLILASFLLIGFMAGFVTTGMVPMLIDRGISPERAAAVASVFGVGVIVGRLSVGWLVDRFFVAWVLIGSMMCPVAGLLMFATGTAGAAVFACALLVGLGIGSENDLLGFSIARYFGRRSYGKLYGLYIASFQIGAGASAVGLGVLRAAYGSYAPGLVAMAAALLVVMLLFTRLGPYVYRAEAKA